MPAVDSRFLVLVDDHDYKLFVKADGSFVVRLDGIVVYPIAIAQPEPTEQGKPQARSDLNRLDSTKTSDSFL